MAVPYFSQTGNAIDASHTAAWAGQYANAQQGPWIYNENLYGFFNTSAGLLIAKSTDLGATWTRLDSAHQPTGANGSACYVVGNQVYVAWNEDTGGGTGPIHICVFNLSTETWGADISVHAITALVQTIYYRPASNTIAVINFSGQNPGSGITLSSYSISGGTWTDTDIGVGIQALANYDFTVGPVAVTSALEPRTTQNRIHVFMVFSSSTATGWSNQCCFFVRVNGATLQQFFTFPGTLGSNPNEGDIHTDSLGYCMGPPCFISSGAPPLAHRRLVVGICRNNPLYLPPAYPPPVQPSPPLLSGGQANYATLYYTADGVTWTELLTGIDPDYVNAGVYQFTGSPQFQIPHNWAEWPPMVWYDGLTLYALYAACIPTSELNPTFSNRANFLRLCTCIPSGDDPSTWNWTCKTVQSIYDYGAVDTPILSKSFSFPKVSVVRDKNVSSVMITSDIDDTATFDLLSYWFGNFSLGTAGVLPDAQYIELPFCVKKGSCNVP